MSLEDLMADLERETTPRVTHEQYAEAVVRLVGVAGHITSGGRAAAQVLLGTYNGYCFHLNATDLCHLDQDNFEAAITVLRGRKELWMEPQRCLADGDAVFRRIWERWEHLHVEQRYAEHYEGDRHAR